MARKFKGSHASTGSKVKGSQARPGGNGRRVQMEWRRQGRRHGTRLMQQ